MVGIASTSETHEIYFKRLGAPMVRNRWTGMSEPLTDEVIELADQDIVCFTPLVACSREGLRLGRGKGCYDRFFAANPQVLRVGVCYSVQVLDSIPTEPHDQKLDYIVSEEEIIKCIY